MTDEKVVEFADAWAKYQLTPKDDIATREELSWASELAFDLAYEDPESLWSLILAAHKKYKCFTIQENLSAGPLEDLLVKHGAEFIDRIEAVAKSDPDFATLLGGVWRNRMTKEIWNRVQAVNDRSGWV